MKQAHLSADNIALGEGLSDKMWLFLLKFDTQMWCLNSNEEVKSANYYYVYIKVLFLLHFSAFEECYLQAM